MSDTGGSAFPVVSIDRVWGDGMTLRDYFAAEAMSAFCFGHSRLKDEFNPDVYPAFANHAYLMADAMLEARKK